MTELHARILRSSKDLLAILDPWLVDPDPQLRVAAVGSLDMDRADAALQGEAVVRALGDSQPDVRAVALCLPFWEVRSDTLQHRIAVRLRMFLSSPRAVERRQALYTLGNMLYGRTALPDILHLADTDPDTQIRWLAARVLSWQRADPRDAQPVLLRMLRDREDTVRVEALLAMGRIGVSGLDPASAGSIVDSVARRLTARYRWTREAAATALASIGIPAIPAMLVALHSQYTAVAVSAATGLGAFPNHREIDGPLLDALSDSRDSVRRAAALALVGAGSHVEPNLQSLVRQGQSPQAMEAKLALGLIEVERMIKVADHCYRIKYGAWIPSLPFRTVEGLLPPAAVRFRPIVARFPREGRAAVFVVEQQFDHVWIRTGWWYPDTVRREIHFDAFPSTSGFRFTIHDTNAGKMVGDAETYWDFRREYEQAKVEFIEISCKPKP